MQYCPVVQFYVKHAQEMTLPRWKARSKRKLSALRTENQDEDLIEASFCKHHLKPNAKTEYAKKTHHILEFRPELRERIWNDVALAKRADKT